jgi:hypothetical protein
MSRRAKATVIWFQGTYGFLKPQHGDKNIFVHISTLPIHASALRKSEMLLAVPSGLPRHQRGSLLRRRRPDHQALLAERVPRKSPRLSCR